MTTNPAARVNYFEKQFLRVDEFLDEQLYQLALRRRHNITQHTWGIVTGLALTLEEDTAVVQPGLAIDGYGRELLLPAKSSLDLKIFDDLAADQLDAWLVYDRKGDGAVPPGYRECGSAADASYRALEVPLVLFERPVSTPATPRRPPGVPLEVLDAPVPPTSDDPAAVWRVYLGRISHLDGKKLTLDPSQRPYAGVVAETIDHPASAARLDLGMRSSAPVKRTIGDTTYEYRKEPGRFAVFVPEDLPPGPRPAAVKLSPRLEIATDGDDAAGGAIHFRGHTVVNGDLRLAAGAVRFVSAANFTAESAPKEPSLYRFSDDGNDELRFDLGSAGGTKRQFVIGFSTPDGKFTECLRIELHDSTGNGDLAPLVTISGDLKVDGQIVGDFVPRDYSPEALAAILGSYQTGLTASAKR